MSNVAKKFTLFKISRHMLHYLKDSSSVKFSMIVNKANTIVAKDEYLDIKKVLNELKKAYFSLWSEQYGGDTVLCFTPCIFVYNKDCNLVILDVIVGPSVGTSTTLQ